MPAPSDLMQQLYRVISDPELPAGFATTIFLLLSPHILYSIVGTEMILRAEHCLRSFSRVTFHISHFLVFLAALENFNSSSWQVFPAKSRFRLEISELLKCSREVSEPSYTIILNLHVSNFESAENFPTFLLKTNSSHLIENIVMTLPCKTRHLNL